jgi:ribonuclease-3
MLDRVAQCFGLDGSAPHLATALTHPSFANEQHDVPDNQRLEFLGDAVLGFCVSRLLYERFPSADEGALTRLRARLVSTESLADWARAHDIAQVLRLGRGAEASGLRSSTNVLADAVEALVAAAYLDGGLEAAERACERIIEGKLAELGETGTLDAKSALQERAQAVGLETPRYEVTDSGGPAHQRWFEVVVRVGTRELGRGRGRSKRAAEFAAAQRALEAPIQLTSDGETRP